jgi:hypothetical protein
MIKKLLGLIAVAVLSLSVTAQTPVYGPPGSTGPPGPPGPTFNGGTITNPLIGPSVKSSILDTGGTTGQVFNAQAYGVLPTNAASLNVTNFTTLLGDWYSNGGGTIFFPPNVLHYKFNACFVIPNNSASLPTQPSLHLTGSAMSGSSQPVPADGPYGSSIIESDCTVAGEGSAVAFIDTRGQGYLEIDHISFTNGLTGQTADVPFIQTTNTIVYIHNNSFLGNMDTGASTSIQDAIVLGGNNTTGLLDGTSQSSFQGYVSIIQGNHFNRIRRMELLQTFANAVVSRDNFCASLCGAADQTTAAIDIEPGYGAVTGGVFSGDSFETYDYPITIKTHAAIGNVFVGENFFDASASTINYFYFDATSSGNTVYAGLTPTGPPTVPYNDLNGGNVTVSPTTIAVWNAKAPTASPQLTGQVKIGAQSSVAGAQTVPLAVTGSVMGYTNTASADTPLAYFGGQSYYGAAGNFGGVQVRSDATTAYLGAVAFFTASVDGTDPSQTPTEKCRINAAGHFGCGTVNPGSGFTVANGDIYVTASASGMILKDTVAGTCSRVQLTSGVLVPSTVTCPAF